MKKNVAIGIVRAWIAFGIIFIPVITIYVRNQPRYTNNDEGALLVFIVGSIVVVVGALALRWVLSAFIKGDD